MSVEGDQLNVELGEEYKKKLNQIAEENQRSMTSQIKYWIDQVK